jgi:hypothetical protein
MSKRVRLGDGELDVLRELIQDELNRHNNLAPSVSLRLGRESLRRLQGKLEIKREPNE